MPPSKEASEVSRQILDTMATLTTERTNLLMDHISEGRATVVDLDDVARFCHLTVPQILAMAREVTPG